jgi:hypothetical protein
MAHTNIHSDRPTAGGLIAVASLVGILVLLSGGAGLIAWFVAH